VTLHRQTPGKMFKSVAFARLPLAAWLSLSQKVPRKVYYRLLFTTTSLKESQSKLTNREKSASAFFSPLQNALGESPRTPLASLEVLRKLKNTAITANFAVHLLPTSPTPFSPFSTVCTPLNPLSGRRVWSKSPHG